MLLLVLILHGTFSVAERAKLLFSVGVVCARVRGSEFGVCVNEIVMKVE